jgi:hypothetical protein
MKKYVPVAVYDNPDDIIQLFPNEDKNRPEFARYAIDVYRKGLGSYRELSGYDEEGIWTEKDIADDAENFFLVGDEYGVRFTKGVYHGVTPYGFYIDIYKALPTKDDYTDEELKLISWKRSEEDSSIKQVIIKELKEAFTEPGTGVDLQYGDDLTVGYGVESGPILKLGLDEKGRITAVLLQDYEDSYENFEDKYFACDDWPKLLLTVRQAIRKGWNIEE